MSNPTYTESAEQPRKPIAWLKGEVRTPPFSRAARIEAGWLLGRLQDREKLGMPHSRPIPSIGPRCHELRIRDENVNWRIIYRIDADAILILDVFVKKSRQLRQAVIAACQRRLTGYDRAAREHREKRDE